MTETILFSGTNTRYLSEKIADYYGQSLGKIMLQQFSDGEMQTNIQESVRGKYVFFIQSTFAPSDNIMELLLMIDAAKRASAGYITAVIPYFGYARQDRKDRPRVAIGAKLLANLLIAAGANRIMTMDLHADQIQGFFDIPVDHLKSEAIFFNYLEKQDTSNVIFASPDVGSTKRARAYAQHFGTGLVICDKYRKKANEVAEMTVIGDVIGKDVILVDDIVDTAGTLCRAAEILIEDGAKSVRAFITHPVLSGPAYQRIEDSQLTEMVVTDTIPLKQTCSKIKVVPVAKLFSRAIRNVHEYRSISALFVKKEDNELVK
jgi:ribose-phosphate pyrophosphokinase